MSHCHILCTISIVQLSLTLLTNNHPFALFVTFVRIELRLEVQQKHLFVVIPRHEYHIARLFVEWKPFDVDSARRRELADSQPLDQPVVVQTDSGELLVIHAGQNSTYEEDPCQNDNICYRFSCFIQNLQRLQFK